MGYDQEGNEQKSPAGAYQRTQSTYTKSNE
jgi:hypothetical protein